MLLTKLDLSSNNITTLEHIRPLTALPNLQTLSLRANPLTSLSSSPNNSLIFPNLNHLDLTSTLLPILSSLNPIPTSFPALTSLLTTQTPLTAYPSASLHTIARLATLTSLNYSRITPPERQNAELYYLSQISKQLASTTDDSEDSRAAILSQHPRWNQLRTIHGEPATTKKAAATTEPLAGTLAARVTTFTFSINNGDLKKAQTHAQTIAGHHHHPVASSNKEPHDPAPHPATTTEKTKLLPTTISTTRLIGIAAHLFSLRPASIKLIWESHEWDPFVIEDGDGAGWSVSEDDDDDDGQEGKKQKKKKKEKKELERREEAQKWKRREVELVHGTREVGFFVDGGKSQEARVRLELR